MQQRRLGSSPVSVSEIGLGTWGMSGSFWGAANDAESIRVVHRALDLGVTLIDTAEAYGNGHSEEVLGEALAGRRSQAVVATKVAPNHLDPSELESALEGSLRRLRTDYVDVYFIHWPNPDFPVGPTMEAMERLRAAGKIRAVGVSNFSPEEMDQARKHGTIDVLQPPYNMLWREIEAATLPYCRANNIGVMPYSGLAQGLLTATLRRDTVFAEGDQRRTTLLFQPGTYEQSLDAVEQLRPIAARYGKSVPQLAVQWLTSRPGVSSPLLGARTVQEMDENAASVGWTISDRDIAEIDRVTKPIWAAIAGKGNMFGYIVSPNRASRLDETSAAGAAALSRPGEAAFLPPVADVRDGGTAASARAWRRAGDHPRPGAAPDQMIHVHLRCAQDQTNQGASKR